MIISDTHKYLFLETPHTGSTAIKNELIGNYDGREIVNKHANYHEFLKVANDEQKKYFVFAGVRNPLDEAVSLYSKLLTDHRSHFSSKEWRMSEGGWVTDRKAEIFELVQKTESFKKFLESYYQLIYTSNIDINKRYCSYIMRFEDLDNELTEAFKQIGIDKKRPLPVANKTEKKGHFTDYYQDKSTREFALEYFGPFMQEWGYDFPESWQETKVELNRKALYKIATVGRELYSRAVKGGPLKNFHFLRNRVE